MTDTDPFFVKSKQRVKFLNCSSFAAEYFNRFEILVFLTFCRRYFTIYSIGTTVLKIIRKL